MRTNIPVRALGFVVLSLSLGWLLAACAAPAAPAGSVEGQVIESGLLAVSGVVVRAQGKTTLTDADGRFTLEEIAVPYDLSLSQTSVDGWLHVLEGLTDRTPVIDPLGYPVLAGSPPTTDVTGALSGGGSWPLPAGRRVVVCAAGGDDVVFGCDTLAFGDSAYAISAVFLTSATAEVRIHALRIVVDGAGRPTGYEGYGAIDATLEAGVPIVLPIDLNVATPVDDFEVAFDVPGGAVLSGTFFVLQLADGGSLPLFDGSVVGDALSLPVPVLAGARYGVFAVVTSAGGNATSWAVGDGFDAGTLAFLVPPQLLTPAPGATGVTTATPFEAVLANPGARTFRWTSGAGPAIALTTTRASVSLPDPVAAGFAWPAGVAYSWSVLAHDATTVDDAAATLDPAIAFLAVFAGLDLPDAGSFATTDGRSLTLAP